MSWVITVLTVLVVLTGVLMTFLILLQEGKGGGLAALGGTKAAGVEGVTNPVRRATAYMAAIFFVLLVALGIMNKPKESVLGGQFNTPGAGAKKEESKPVEAPKPAEAPKPTEAPKAEAPAAPAPAAPAAPEAPKTDAPKSDASKAEAPKAEEKKAEEKKAEAPKAGEAKK